ncbi:UNVERIFIED_ORG: RHS repeat-associated protein [Pseudomonas putida]|nr:RHS repeat-associated protein [Pseudomonas putida]
MGYWRDNDGVLPQARVNRTVHDGVGRAIAQWDPRLFPDASAPANLQTVYALSGAVLSTGSVDAGWRVALLGVAGQAVQQWDGRGSRWMQYDTQLRPELVFEQAVGGEAVCAERFGYGLSDETSVERNQCGQLIRHDDPAGTQRFAEFGLHGAVLEQTRHFLNDLTLSDWPESIVDRDLLWEPGEGATTRSQVNALGEVSRQTDAKGHRQLFSQTLGGQLREVRLQLNGKPTPKTLVSAITYNAHGQTEREVAGNGVITTLEYDAQNGRLTRLSAQRGNEALQDLNYAYDPVGNVLSIKDAALPIRYFANQRIEPVNCYFYDSLSQLIEALGWEAGSANKGPQFSTFNDPAPRANYRQTYHYNLGGSLLELTHKGPQNHAHRLVSAAHSNRCLPVLEGVEPGEEDFRRGFDGNGNLLKLQPGQALAWDLRNQLGEVRPVVRDSGLNDLERYVYGADGMRLRKVRETLAHARTLVAETRYLPNLELRKYSGTGEVLQVINVQAGRSSVRVLHWESVPPKDSANDQYRYHLNDHLGSCTLELDDDGEVISQERYHPYGTTAWFAGRGEVEASYRTVRYSGKERDATGLYYYGFRYYAAGWQRWLNPDPAGEVDGHNLYKMVGNNLLAFNDPNGQEKKAINKDIHQIWVGEAVEKLAQHIGNINNTVEQASGYKVHLYLEVANEDAYSEVINELKVHDVIYLRGDSLFRKFKKSSVAPIYKDFRSGDQRNFAFAVDVLRPYVVRKLGGIYSDVDDRYYSSQEQGKERLGDTTLYAERNEVLVARPVVIPWESQSSTNAVQINNSSFAAHSGSAILKRTEKEMISRYKKVVKSGQFTDGRGYIGVEILEEETPERMKVMSSMVGPQVFTDIIKGSDSEIDLLLKQARYSSFGGVVPTYEENVTAKMPLSRFIGVGSFNSWK